MWSNQKLAVVGSLIMLGISALGGIFGNSGGKTSPPILHSDLGAWSVCRQFVDRNLVAPATADYPWGYSDYTRSLGGGHYVVSAYVDSENGFGAKLRSYFKCEVRQSGEADNYRLTDLEFGDGPMGFNANGPIIEPSTMRQSSPPPKPVPLKTATPKPILVPTATPRLTHSTVNSVSKLRGGPGTHYPITGQAVPRQTVVLVARNQAGDWYKLDNGKWIAAFLVDNAPANLPVARGQ